LLRAAAGRELSIMIPMVTTADEMDDVQAVIDRERKLLRKKGIPAPQKLQVGAMIEVPSVLFELEALLPKVDFASVGSNDLLQFLFAADRTNARVASRYDSLSAAPLKALKTLVKTAKKHKVPLTVCGEMAGSTLEAMTLIGLGIRTLSMAPASIGPVKTMILSLNAGRVAEALDDLLASRSGSIRRELERFARSEKIEL
jgi:phosphotransferase system enzyme I (PtsP)